MFGSKTVKVRFVGQELERLQRAAESVGCVTLSDYVAQVVRVRAALDCAEAAARSRQTRLAEVDDDAHDIDDAQSITVRSLSYAEARRLLEGRDSDEAVKQPEEREQAFEPKPTRFGALRLFTKR
jgi:hypothetical protein